MCCFKMSSLLSGEATKDVTNVSLLFVEALAVVSKYLIQWSKMENRGVEWNGLGHVQISEATPIFILTTKVKQIL